MRSKGSRWCNGKLAAANTWPRTIGKTCTPKSRTDVSTSAAGGSLRRELAERMFHTDFPHARHREHRLVSRISDGGASRLIHSLRSRKQPQPHVRIKQKLHGLSPSKYAWISAGSGASKSSGTTSFPRRVPKRRWFDGPALPLAGTSSSTTMTSTRLPSNAPRSGTAIVRPRNDGMELQRVCHGTTSWVQRTRSRTRLTRCLRRSLVR